MTQRSRNKLPGVNVWFPLAFIAVMVLVMLLHARYTLHRRLKHAADAVAAELRHMGEKNAYHTCYNWKRMPIVREKFVFYCTVQVDTTGQHKDSLTVFGYFSDPDEVNHRFFPQNKADHRLQVPFREHRARH